MLTIEYDPNSENHYADSAVERQAEIFYDLYINGDFVDSNVVDYKTSTALLIDAFRVGIAEGKFDHTKIQFKFKDEILMIDKNGRCPSWPRGFCDTHTDFMCRILKANAEVFKRNEQGN